MPARARAPREGATSPSSARSEPSRERSRDRDRNRGRDRDNTRPQQRPPRQSAAQPQQGRQRQEQRQQQRAERKQPTASSAPVAAEHRPQSAAQVSNTLAADKPAAETPRVVATLPPTQAPAREHPKPEAEASHQSETAQSAPDQKAVNADGTPAKRRRGRRGGRRRKRAAEAQGQQMPGKVENLAPGRDLDDEDSEPSRASASHSSAHPDSPTPSHVRTDEHASTPAAKSERAEASGRGSLGAHSSAAHVPNAPSTAPTGASGTAEIRSFPVAAAPSPVAQDSAIETAPVAARLPTPAPFAAGERAPAGNNDAAAPLPSPSEGASEAAATVHRPALGAGGGIGASQPQGGFNAPGSATTPPQSAFAPHQGDLLPKPSSAPSESTRTESGSESVPGSN